jgi:hypothetical protein
MVEVYLHSPIHLHGIVLKTALPFTLCLITWYHNQTYGDQDDHLRSTGPPDSHIHLRASFPRHCTHSYDRVRATGGLPLQVQRLCYATAMKVIVLYCIVLYCIYSVFKTSMRRIQNTVNIQHADNNKYMKFKVLNIMIKIKLKIKIKSTINKQLWSRKSQDKTFQITEYESNWESLSRTTMYIQNKNKQTPWPLVRERNIPTEWPPLVDEI